MKCEACKGKTYTIDSRLAEDGSTKRRHRCVKCDHRFNTNEFTEDALLNRDLEVLKEMAVMFNDVYKELKIKKGLTPCTVTTL
jgi:transcriptional regulator NrdR family protein